MNIVKTLESIINGNSSPEEFIEILKEQSNGITRTGIMLSEGTTVYRTRKYNEAILPELKSHISYPPIDITQLQRLSGNGQQLFYASTGYKTAFVECRPKKDEYIVLSEWMHRTPMILSQIGILSNKKYQELEDFLVKIFSQKDNAYYKYTSKIATHLLSGDTINGLAYPSISSKYESHNLGIKTDYVDNDMTLTQAYLYKIIDVNETDEEFEVEEIAYTEDIYNDRLLWFTGQSRRLFI